MTVTATLTVNFQTSTSDSEQSGQLVLMVDDRENGLNGGKASGFLPGDSVYILRFLQSGLSITNQGSTAGSLTSAGSGNYDVEQVVTFTNNRESSLQFPVSGNFAYSWLGRSLGNISVANSSKLVIPAAGFGIAKVTYKAAYSAFRLHAVAATIDTVLVYAQAE